MLALYHIANTVGTKNFMKKMTQLKDAVDKSEEIGVLFAHFTNNQWIFDN
jgi:hypothetical protein